MLNTTEPVLIPPAKGGERTEKNVATENSVNVPKGGIGRSEKVGGKRSIGCRCRSTLVLYWVPVTLQRLTVM